MTTLTTILQLVLIWLATWLMGLPIVKALLPEDLERPYGTLIAPTVGYLTFCFFAFTISASLGIAAATACWIVMAALGAAAIATQLRPAWRIDPRALGGDFRRSLVLILPMALVTLLPLFYYGADTYLGAVNPDYFAGLVDNYFLLKGHSVASFAPVSGDTFHPIDLTAGHLSVSARFGAGVFGIAIHLLLGGAPMRTALTLAIGFFLLSLPLTLYFFCRVAMRMEERAATLSAWLIGISAPVGMSYLYFYLGQNSGLPALPLLLAACFLMLVRPGVRTLLFCTILANALFVNYFAMLPYALAPAGALGLYLVATRRLSFTRALVLAVAFFGITAVLKLGNVRETVDSMRAWMNVIGQSLQGQFFLDFLTESFFPYFLGLYNYPSNPWYVRLLGYVAARIGGFAVAAGLLVLVGYFVWRWAKDNADKASRVFIVSALVIYAAVWYRYSFQQQYGYAVFKMSSWLQFIVVPFMAYGFLALRDRRIAGGPSLGARALSIAGMALCGAYAILNLVASLEYDHNGTGRNTDTGYIINHFGVAGNRDYFELPVAVAKHVKPDQPIGLMFTDSIRNYWTSYYLKDFSQSILAHEALPGDDENLPDIQTGNVVDYYGNVRHDANAFFHGGSADRFYLTWSDADINQDIVRPKFRGAPLWRNGSFELFGADQARDVLYTGRGFYRLEYFKPVKDYFFPTVLRWSAEGGEFFLLRAAEPGKPYRIAFDAIVGYEYRNDYRTLEFWLDGKKFGEVVVRHNARVVSPAFVPTGDLHKIVVSIKERNKPIPREIPLWNKNVPVDYRRMNIGFSNVSVVPPEGKPTPPVPAGSVVPLLEVMHRYAEQFNGIQLDGWLGETPADVVLSAPPGAKKLEVGGFVPGNLGFSFPYALTVRVNAREYERRVDKAGPFTIEVPLEPAGGRLSMAMVPSQSVDLHEESVRHKVLRRSIRLDSFAFR